MASSIIGSLRVTLGLDTAEFESGSKKAVASSATTSAQINKHLGTIVAAGKAIAGAAIAKQIFDVAAAGLDYASSLAEVAQQLGVTTNDLQVYRYAASQVGISNEEMDKGLAKLTVTIGKAADGSSEQVKAFRELGLSATNADGSIRTAGQFLPKLADALAKVQDPATRARIELEFFGKTGQKLDTLLSGGSAAIDELAKAATDLGLVLTPEQIANADNAADKFSEVKQVLEANIASAVANNAKTILDLANAFETLVVSIAKAVSGYSRWRLQIGVRGQDSIIDGFATTDAQKDVARAKKNDLLGQISDLDGPTTGTRFDMKRGRFVNDDSTPKPLGDGALPVDKAAAAAAFKKAAADAAKQASEALRREDKYQTDLGRAESDLLGLRQQLTSDAGLQANYAHQQIDIEAEARDRELSLAVQEKQITAAAAAELRLRYDRNDELKHAVVNRELDAKLQQDDLDVRNAVLGNLRDQLSAQSGLAKTSRERLAKELQILDADYDQQRAQLDAVLASRDSTEAQKKIAQARLDILDGLKAADAEKITRQNEGPGASYLRSLQQTPDQIAESIESGAVAAVQSLDGALTDTIGNVFKLKGAFGSVANSIISDLIRIAVQKNITGPLASALFAGEGGGGGGIFGSIGKLLGAASGGGVSSAITGATSLSGGVNFSPSLDLAALPKFATGGSFKVGGVSGVDKNLVQFAATKGEMVNITHGENDNGRGGIKVDVTPSPYFDVRVTEVAGPMADNAAMRGADGGARMAGRNAQRSARQRISR